MTTRTALVILLAVLLGACGGSSGGPVGVEVSFDPGTPRTLRDEAVRVEVYLVEDCDMVTLGERPDDPIASTFTLRDDDGMGPLGGAIDLGSFGLYALAQDDDCAVVAATCAPVIVDATAPLSITLNAFSGTPCDSNTQWCVVETGECMSTGNILCAGEPDQTGCLIDGSTGLCRTGECCTGCWDGTECRPGTSTQQCGTAGETCQFVPGCPN